MDFLLNFDDKALNQDCEHSAKIANKLSGNCEQTELWTNWRFLEFCKNSKVLAVMLFYVGLVMLNMHVILLCPTGPRKPYLPPDSLSCGPKKSLSNKDRGFAKGSRERCLSVSPSFFIVKNKRKREQTEENGKKGKTSEREENRKTERNEKNGKKWKKGKKRKTAAEENRKNRKRHRSGDLFLGRCERVLRFMGRGV